MINPAQPLERPSSAMTSRPGRYAVNRPRRPPAHRRPRAGQHGLQQGVVLETADRGDRTGEFGASAELAELQVASCERRRRSHRGSAVGRKTVDTPRGASATPEAAEDDRDHTGNGQAQ